MSLNDYEKRKIHNVYKTLNEMLNDRGYSPNVLSDYNTFCEKYCTDYEINRSTLNFICNQSEGRRQPCDLFLVPILVYFIEDDSVGIKNIKRIYESMMEKKLKHCIVIYKNIITFSAKNYISSKMKQVRFELFSDDELIFNPTRHVLCPRYKILDQDGKKNLLLKYSIQDQNLPKILVSDIIVKYYGLRKGTVIEITRKSETGGINVTYRIVS
jgi:DNA-directed RNA polymerase I, II, and III subunit RPABC1